MVDRQDLMQQISRAGAMMDPALSDQDVDRLLAGASVRRRRRRTRRLVVTGATAVVVALSLVVLVQRRPDAFHGRSTATAKLHGSDHPLGDERVIRLTDGSTAVALDPTTEIAVAEDTPDRVSLQLARGRSRFDVTPRPARTFVVHVGEVTVSVLGTRFTVERVADRVGLAVEHGTVRVDWAVGSTRLKDGDSGWYPPLVVSGQAGGAVSTISPEKTDRSPMARPRPVRSARSSLTSSSAPESETAKQLLLAADKARMAGHPEDGAVLLRKLLREHRNDPRAPLAAFTLGRMLLMELANPIEAASVFAEARRLSPQGPFAEDALAREVEALNQAGATALAKARALEYLRLYPDGRRATVVRRTAGIQ